MARAPTSSAMPLPNFIILGAPKAGTTSLAYHLARHPQVCFSSKKEPDFFARYYDRGLDWYRAFFDHWTDEPAIGEGSVHYSVTRWFPDAPARIAEHLPHARFIYMARHPIDRMESMWTQHISTGLPLPDFNTAVREWRPLIDGSLYEHQYGQYREHFPAERFCCLFFEDFVADPAQTLRKVCEFLEIDPELVHAESHENRNARDSLLMDCGPWKAIRNTALGRACRAHVPEPVKQALRRLFRKPIDVDAMWEPTTLRWAIEQVRDDASAWLERHERDPAFWDFSDAYVARKLDRSGREESGRLARPTPTMPAGGPNPRPHVEIAS